MCWNGTTGEHVRGLAELAPSFVCGRTSKGMNVEGGALRRLTSARGNRPHSKARGSSPLHLGSVFDRVERDGFVLWHALCRKLVISIAGGMLLQFC
jgi:hypothetical protein